MAQGWVLNPHIVELLNWEVGEIGKIKVNYTCQPERRDLELRG